ncbi:MULTISPECIES: VOC family protein [Amycolatopsis]|uniref:VOC family protein n=1 Tax=Amycolatopsis TaxID=1813 RepID=UPI000B8AFF3D|nr:MULTISPECIES: VOC family protein [Amycolatopsis]OXM69276.1 glyoxalase [Amycolatopsis sp. KNN50.9b]
MIGMTLPMFRQVVLDCTDARRLAEFYRELLGLVYRPGDEDGPADWLVLRTPDGIPQLAFQQVDALPEATWPDGPVPQQLHLDLTVPRKSDLAAQHERVLRLGARLLRDRSDDPDEPLYVYADPAGHPFCVFVA